MSNTIPKIEYQIYIGCNDGRTKNLIVSEEDLRNTVSNFFERNKIDFSMITLNGGFLHSDGSFVIEDTLCINIITDNDNKINNLVNDLSMFMNQESTLVVRHQLSADFR